MSRARRGMALAITIGVVSLIAILAVATLSLAGRLVQTSSMGLRDARLDAGAAFGLAMAADRWRQLHLGRMAIGSSQSFSAKPSSVPLAVVVVVTRLSPEIFWVVAEAAEAGAVRRENLVLSARVPDAPSLLADDSTNVDQLGWVIVDSIVANADERFPPGATIPATDGVIYVAGDATLTGGAGSGVMIVDGRLTITGSLTYEGVIVARAGISVVVPGVTITGLIRAKGSPPVVGNISTEANVAVAQDVLRQALTPVPVRGRRWAELH